MKKQTVLFVAAIGAALATGCSAAPMSQTTIEPEARAQTAPVPHKKDAADDPAIWIHPQNPDLSLILGTDKQGGLHAYNMDGTAHALVSDGSKPNNVDLIYNFKRDGRTVDLAVATVRAPVKSSKKGKSKNAMPLGLGVKVWEINAATRSLTEVTEGGTIPVPGAKEPYGVCTYHSARTDRSYFFVTADKGRIDQFELKAAADGKITATPVRRLNVPSVAEGCVADDEQGNLYVSEESSGIWKFGAEPDASTEGRLVARVGESGLTAHVEGLAIYYASQGRGYLIASSQGNNTFKVYERSGDNRYVLTIDPKGGRIDDVNDTDGIAVTSCPTSRQFAKGLFIVQDGTNAGGNQNFKLYAWEDIAGTSLLMDTTWQPRSSK